MNPRTHQSQFSAKKTSATASSSISSSQNFEQKKEKAVLLDLSKEQASEQFFPNLPLLTSHGSGWSGIHLEHHVQPAWETPEHIMPAHVISISLDRGTVPNDRWVDGKFQFEKLTKSTIAIIPANTLHRAAWTQTGEFLALALEPKFFSQIAQEWVNPDRSELIPHFSSEPDPLILELSLALKTELETGCLGRRLYGDSLATSLVVHLLRKYSTFEPKPQQYQGGLSRDCLCTVIDYIQSHLAENISLEAIAQTIDMSQYYFCRLFKQSIGISPYQYLIQQRLERAKQLIEKSRLSIAEIAQAVGFCEQSQLAYHFKRTTGLTPKQWRKR